MMFKILEILGPQTKETLAFASSEARQYVLDTQEFIKDKKAATVDDLYNGANTDLI